MYAFSAINYHLSTGVAGVNGLCKVALLFSPIQDIINFPETFWPTDYLEMYYWISNLLNFSFIYYWFLVWLHYGQIIHSAWFHFFKMWWSFVLGPRIRFILVGIPWAFEMKVFSAVNIGILYMYYINWLTVLQSSFIFLLFSCLVVLSVW